MTSLLASFALSKNKNSEASRLRVGTHPLLPPFPVLYFYRFLCVFCSSIPFLSVLFVFHKKSLVLLHLMNRYTTSTIEHFFKKENTFWKVNFWYQWIIQCNTDSCCEYMAGDVNIYLYGCLSLLVPDCADYLVVYFCKTHSRSFWY